MAFARVGGLPVLFSNARLLEGEHGDARRRATDALPCARLPSKVIHASCSNRRGTFRDQPDTHSRSCDSGVEPQVVRDLTMLNTGWEA